MTEPRYDNHAEQAVLGAMLGDRGGDVFDAITEIITPADFYKPRHAELAAQMLTLRGEGRPIDALAMAHAIAPAELARLGGVPYLHDLLQAVPAITNGPYYAREVRGLAVLRQLQTHAARTAQRAATATPTDAQHAIDDVQADAADISLRTAGTTDTAGIWQDMATEAVDEMLRIEKLAESDELPGIPTGWPDLDKLLNNLQGGQVVILAGRPGLGKSIAGRNIAQNVAMRRNQPALLFTLEMSRTECMLAFISAGAGVPLDTIRSGRLGEGEWLRIARYLGDTRDAPLLIDDTAGATLSHARTVMRRQIRAGRKPAVVIWDYLQLTPVDGFTNRQEAVSALSRGFKLFAKEYDIPVVLISQLNRGPEQRSDKRPGLSDLRESGSLEQDADVVILLHRDDYYDKESPRAGEMDLIIAKNRHGATDTITLAAQLHLQRLMSMAVSA